MRLINACKKIDIHAHVIAFPDSYPVSPRTGQQMLSGEKLLAMYDRLDIEIGVLQTLVSPEAMLSPLTSESCKAVADRFPQRLRWFCGVDPRALSNTEGSDLTYLLKHYQRLGAKGLGEVNANLMMDSPMIDNLFTHCEECGMPVLLHMGRRLGGGYGLVDEPGLPKFERMLQKHSSLKIIGHSIPFWNELSSSDAESPVTEGRIAFLMRRYENLYCDLSAGSGSHAMMRDPDYASDFLTEFQDRIYYGCDIVSCKDTYPFLFRDFLDGLVESGKISESVFRKIARENAEKLLDIDPEQTQTHYIMKGN